MTETTVGRKPTQVVSLTQHRCGKEFSVGRCRGGNGAQVAEQFSTTWASGTLDDWTCPAGSIENMELNGLWWTTAAIDAYIASPTYGTGEGFDGDVYQWVVVRGKYIAGTSHEWNLYYQSDASAAVWAGDRRIAAENKTELSAMSAGTEFVAVFDASTSTNYATEWQGTYINQIRFDSVNNADLEIELYSIDVVTQNPLANRARACFKTLTTCHNEEDYEGQPLGSSRIKATDQLSQLDTFDTAELDTASAFTIALDVEFPSSPSGVIWEAGGSATGAYIGVTGTDLVVRCGSGLTGHPSDTAKITTPVATYCSGRNVTLVVSFSVDNNSASLTIWDSAKWEVMFTDSDVAVSSFTAWAGSDAGAVGTYSGAIVAGETSTDFDGTINWCKHYNKLRGPTIADEYRNVIYFTRGNVADRLVGGADRGVIFPFLKTVSTSPTKINIANTDSDAQGLGNRALCTLQFADGISSDRAIDPYLADRDYDPLTRSTFWRKFLARDKYLTGTAVNVYNGYEGQTLGQYRLQKYSLENITLNDSGGVTIQGKDQLAKLEERKAQAPLASNGELYQDITADETEIRILGALITEYPASGTLRIDDELITYSAIADNGEFLTVTVTERGSDASTATEHSAEAIVQECLRYTLEEPYIVLRDLLSRAGVNYTWMDYDNWKDEIDNHLPAYNLTTIISKPTAITKLVSDIQEQCLIYLWWDETDVLIKLRAVRGIGADPDVLTDEQHIMAGSLNIKALPRQRTSQVWVYYNPRDWTKSLSEEDTWENAFILADLPSEGPDQHGQPSVRKIFGQWLPTGALAENTASKLLTRYVDVPRMCTFKLDAKDRDNYGIGDVVQILTDKDVDRYGERKVTFWTITSREEPTAGEVMQYTAEDTTLYGKIYVVQAGGSSDYSGDPTTIGDKCFIGDANGLLSDGEPCGRIS